jgi:hypothetical protein
MTLGPVAKGRFGRVPQISVGDALVFFAHPISVALLALVRFATSTPCESDGYVGCDAMTLDMSWPPHRAIRMHGGPWYVDEQLATPKGATYPFGGHCNRFSGPAKWTSFGPMTSCTVFMLRRMTVERRLGATTTAQ